MLSQAIIQHISTFLDPIFVYEVLRLTCHMTLGLFRLTLDCQSLGAYQVPAYVVELNLINYNYHENLLVERLVKLRLQAVCIPKIIGLKYLKHLDVEQTRFQDLILEKLPKLESLTLHSLIQSYI